MKWLAVFLIVVAPALPAQTARAKKKPAAVAPKTGPVAQAFPVASIGVEGNKIYPTERVVAASGLKVGDVAGTKEFDAARDRLLATGAFSSVGYRFTPAAEGRGYAAVFQVEEIQQVFPFKIQSLPVDVKSVQQALRRIEPLFVDKLPPTEQLLARVSKEIEAQLAKEGHPEKVIGKVSAEPGGQMVVVFRPSRLASVAEVHFSGNQEVAQVTLQGAIVGVAIGSQYTEENFRQLLDTSVRPVYEKIGKIRVTFPKLTTEPAKDVDGLVVNVEVNEGPTYKLGAVNIIGQRAGDQALLKEGGFKIDDVANFAEIKEGVDRIDAMLRNAGYMRVQTDAERKIDDKKHTVDLNIKIEPGPQFQFGILTIDGLDIETEPQVRKMWALKSGQPYKADYPYYFLRRIEGDGVFENLGKTRTALHIDDETRKVDVTLFFSASGKALPAIGPARDQLERQRRTEEKNRQPF
jgi:outer membrane protein insertion porin family